MALIKTLKGMIPKIGKGCFLADNATILGDVTIGDECSIWFNTVLRGDVNTITIGNRVNIQDGSVLHTLYQKSTMITAMVSPMARPTPKMIAAIMPDLAAGTTVKNTLRTWPAPSASAPS